MASRETRRYKQKGVSVSFGDIMLPLIGIVAIGLLLVGGKLFFLGVVRPERSSALGLREQPTVETEPVRADEPLTEHQVVAEASPASKEPFDSSSSAIPAASLDGAWGEKTTELNSASMEPSVLATPYGSVASHDAGAKEETPAKVPEAPKPSAKRVEVVVSPSRKPAIPAKAPRVPAASLSPQPPSPKPAPSKPTTPAKTPTPSKTRIPLWQVQVGAFSTRESAVEVSRKLSQSGYKASVVSGTKFHKVLVQAGSTKQDAARIASRLDKEGFPGAFSVPPALP